MGALTQIAVQWRITDDAFAQLQQAALTNGDENAFDTADDHRRLNNQAYFLYLFTRFEAAATAAVRSVVSDQLAASASISRRVWAAWSSLVIKDDRQTNFMSKVEVLLDKSRSDYAMTKRHYEGRNTIAHGGVHNDVFVIPDVAIEMERIIATFPVL